MGKGSQTVSGLDETSHQDLWSPMTLYPSLECFRSTTLTVISNSLNAQINLDVLNTSWRISCNVHGKDLPLIQLSVFIFQNVYLFLPHLVREHAFYAVFGFEEYASQPASLWEPQSSPDTLGLLSAEKENGSRLCFLSVFFLDRKTAYRKTKPRMKQFC